MNIDLDTSRLLDALPQVPVCAKCGTPSYDCTLNNFYVPRAKGPVCGDCRDRSTELFVRQIQAAARYYERMLRGG